MKTLFFHGDKKREEIAITFDDGPCERTLEILKVLKKEEIPATFFILGKKIRNNERILKQMIKQECEIGNHTYSHDNLWLKTPKRMEKELSDTDKELEKLGVSTNLMRCPHFRFGLTIFLIARRLKKKIIFGSLDSRDWTQPGKEAIVDRVLKEAKNGAIICLHDYLEEIGENPDVVPAIKEIIPKLKEEGFKFVTLSNLVLRKEN